jgi:hypothetical protein
MRSSHRIQDGHEGYSSLDEIDYEHQAEVVDERSTCSTILVVVKDIKNG